MEGNAETPHDIKVKELKSEVTAITLRLHNYNVARKVRKLTPQESADRDKLRERLQFANRELAIIYKERRKSLSKGNHKYRGRQWLTPVGGSGFEIWTEPSASNNSKEVNKEKKRTPKIYSHAAEERFYYHGKLRTTAEIRNLLGGVSMASSAVTKPRRKRKANPCPNQKKDDSTDKKQKEWKPSPTNKKWKKKWKPNPTKWEPEF